MSVVQKKKTHLTVYLSSNMKKEIIIAGYGFVGKAVGLALAAEHTIHIVDPKINTSSVSDYKTGEGVIICVGTPSLPNGSCDDTQIRSVLENTPDNLPVLIKSTIPPDQLSQILVDYPNHHICYSPEFLRAATADEDFLNQEYMIIGGEDFNSFWENLFSSVLKKCEFFLPCSITEASMIKYSINSFLSTKVAFFNQIYEVCQANGADYELVKQLVSADTRIGLSHMNVPGSDGLFGFGGACFPKDTNAFIHYAKNLNTPVTVVEEVVKYNNKIRK